MKKIAIEGCHTEEEKLAVKDMTLAKLHDFGILRTVGRKPYPTHAFDLLTDNTSKAAKVQCALFKGTTRDIFIDRKEFTGPIYQHAETKRLLKLFIICISWKRGEPEFRGS